MLDQLDTSKPKHYQIRLYDGSKEYYRVDWVDGSRSLDGRPITYMELDIEDDDGLQTHTIQFGLMYLAQKTIRKYADTIKQSSVKIANKAIDVCNSINELLQVFGSK